MAGYGRTVNNIAGYKFTASSRSQNTAPFSCKDVWKRCRLCFIYLNFTPKLNSTCIRHMSVCHSDVNREFIRCASNARCKHSTVIPRLGGGGFICWVCSCAFCCPKWQTNSLV